MCIAMEELNLLWLHFKSKPFRLCLDVGCFMVTALGDNFPNNIHYKQKASQLFLRLPGRTWLWPLLKFWLLRHYTPISWLQIFLLWHSSCSRSTYVRSSTWFAQEVCISLNISVGYKFPIFPSDLFRWGGWQLKKLQANSYVDMYVGNQMHLTPLHQPNS